MKEIKIKVEPWPDCPNLEDYEKAITNKLIAEEAKERIEKNWGEEREERLYQEHQEKQKNGTV